MIHPHGVNECGNTRRSGGMAVAHATKGVRNSIRVLAGVLDIVADRLAVEAEVENNVIAYDAIIHGFASLHLYVQAVG